jgi:hypothetical protein
LAVRAAERLFLAVAVLGLLCRAAPAVLVLAAVDLVLLLVAIADSIAQLSQLMQLMQLMQPNPGEPTGLRERSSMLDS